MCNVVLWGQNLKISDYTSTFFFFVKLLNVVPVDEAFGAFKLRDAVNVFTVVLASRPVIERLEPCHKSV